MGFDALFIPDSPERISMIVPQLAFHDVRGVKLLGTSAWDTPDILKAGSELLGEAIFVDAFSPNSFYPEVNDFTDIYYTNYSREPDAMEALAYDAAGIIVKIIMEDGIKTRDQFRAEPSECEGLPRRDRENIVLRRARRPEGCLYLNDKGWSNHPDQVGMGVVL